MHFPQLNHPNNQHQNKLWCVRNNVSVHMYPKSCTHLWKNSYKPYDISGKLNKLVSLTRETC